MIISIPRKTLILIPAIQFYGLVTNFHHTKLYKATCSLATGDIHATSSRKKTHSVRTTASDKKLCLHQLQN
jgi:hypothetical protein